MHLKLTVVALLMLTSAVASADDVKYVQREVRFGAPIKLSEFGGPNIDVAINAREMTYVTGLVTDYTKLVPVVKANVQGANGNSGRGANAKNQVVMQPTRSDVRVEKKYGERFQGTRSDMYLLYREPNSGIGIYFLDSISRANFDNVVIAVPPVTDTQAPPANSAAAPANDTPPPPAKTTKVASTTQGGDGVLSKELLAWYSKLQAARQSLDLNDQAAVTRFNEQAAQYQEALRKAREAKKAQRANGDS